MDRHFILPLTIAAALHAGLLFGFRRHSIELPTVISKIIPAASTVLIPFDPAPPPEPDEAAVLPPKGATSEAAPSLEEHLDPPRPGDFPIEIPRHEPTTVANVTTIPPGPIGPPGDSNIPNPGGPGLLNFKDLDNIPRARLQTGPAYPAEARRSGLAGVVLVEFTVNESGIVISQRAVHSTDRMFEEPALRAVAKWRFEPGLRNGRAVSFRMAVPIVFSLSEN